MKLKQILTVLAVAAATVALVGCERPKGINVTSKEFERKVTEGVYKVAKAQYAFNKTTDQLYFNKATNTFRIVSNDGTKYIEVAFAAPIGSVGAKVQASVKSEGFEDVENFDSIEFEIMKKEGQNCWLWCQAHALGVLAFYIPKSADGGACMRIAGIFSQNIPAFFRRIGKDDATFRSVGASYKEN